MGLIFDHRSISAYKYFIHVRFALLICSIPYSNMTLLTAFIHLVTRKLDKNSSFQLPLQHSLERLAILCELLDTLVQFIEGHLVL